MPRLAGKRRFRRRFGLALLRGTSRLLLDRA
jgi:hypothetical protein